ncbi:hypothetical protein [Streptomyces erythrochromogenes]|uniref:hypothetical protein n=1 Tax=Streptomyces erythrochromogenes TaxID=285574 RepID=UPI00368C0DAC
MMTFSARPARRTTVSAVAVAVVAVGLSVLSGCKGGSSGAGATAPASSSASSAAPAASAAPVAGAFEPEQALAEAEKTPYAASLKAVTEAAGSEMSTMTGRSNLGTVFTGRSEIRSTGLWMETVTTADANYVRNRTQEGSGWVKTPRSPDNEANYAGYAKLLLAAGPSAKKGMENRGGVPVYHLAGHLDLDQVASIDPRTHRSMKAKGVTGFDIDQWIDSQGRTVRFEQRMEMRGVQAANKIDFSEFGPVETFAAPQG